jgi:microcystin-dependent protein
MGTPYLAEIRVFSFNFAPKGWALCNGQLLPINQNQALFSLLGTTYGGNGQTTFALPNLQGRTPLHFGNGYVLGQAAGEANHTLLASEMPQHTHTALASAGAANSGVPTNNFWANGNQPAYDPNPTGPMVVAAVSMVGSSQPHNNTPPYLTLLFCIALQGIFPSQN